MRLALFMFIFVFLAAASASTGETVSDLDLLACDDLYDLSSAGSHSYLRVGEALGIPELYYRQFSDWHPTGALLDPVLELTVEGRKPQRRAYTWYPDRVEMEVAYGDALAGEETLAYVGRDVVLARLELVNRTDGPLPVTFSGMLSDKASGTALPDVPLGMSITTRADMGSFAGARSKLDEEWLIRWSTPLGRFSLEGHSYSFSRTLPPGERITFFVGLARKKRAGELSAAMADPDAAFRKAADEVRAWLAQAPKGCTDPVRIARAWYWLWYNTLEAEGLWTADIITPSKAAYARGIWLWDSAFHVMALMRGGPAARKLAADQIRVLVSNEVDGHIPREVWVDVANPDVQPPGILTWAAMELYERTGDTAFLAEIYPALRRNDEWFYAHRDGNRNGLAEWAGGDSGWDCSPRWDDGKVDAVDLNTWLALDQEKLADMAEALGKSEEARRWRGRAAESRSRLMSFWDEEDGCFYDLPRDGSGFVRVKTPAIFWPMLVGAPVKDQVRRLVDHLKDPNEFWTRWPLPAVAIDEPEYDARSYWRGPTWVHLNWIVSLGLRRYGYDDLADELLRRSVRLIEKSPAPYEYYNAETGEPLGARNYMWTAALYVVMSDELAERRK